MTIIGVDEVGRGPIAGPVIAAAVILPDNFQLNGLTDSKKLTEKKRLQLALQIKSQAVQWAYGHASVVEIDRINILQASLLAMKRAVEKLKISTGRVLVDGNHCPKIELPAEAIVGGDSCVPQISAASIVAKVIRDYLMTVLDKAYPAYGLAKHKGYPTKVHLAALAEHGVVPIHRKSFGPVKRILGNE